MQRLRAVSALIDAEAIVYDHQGMPNFDYIHSKQYDHEVSLLTFDLLEQDGEDLRALRLDERKRRLQHLISKVRDGIEYIEHIEGDGDKIFDHACKLRHEGIIAKRVDRPYESGRSRHWVKIKNPDSPAMKRVQDETF